MLKKTILSSLSAGSCVVLGHSYYYKNKNKNLNDCSIINEENINKCNFLNDNIKKKIINLLK